jgi:hypothetical protein
MMVNSAQLDEGGGGVHDLHLSLLSTITSKVVYALAERADALTLFLLYPFLLCGSVYRRSLLAVGNGTYGAYGTYCTLNTY